MMKVLIEATYGINSFGDDLLLELLKSYLNGQGIRTIVAGNIKNNRSIVTISVGRLAFLDKLFAISRCKFVVIGGGGQFNDNTSRTGGAHLILTMVLAFLLRTQVIILATGFGPLNKRIPRLIWKVLFKVSNPIVSFREKTASACFLDLIGRKSDLVRDIALSNFSFNHILSCSNKNHIKRIKRPLSSCIVNLRHFRLPKCSMEMIQSLHERNDIEVNAIRTDLIDDLSCRDWKRFGVCSVIDYRNPSSTINEIANSEFVITQRFHVLVICLILSKPVLPVCYAAKMKDLCDELNLPSLSCDFTVHDFKVKSDKFFSSYDSRDVRTKFNDYLTRTSDPLADFLRPYINF